MFRGPKVEKVNRSGIEHVIHFIMPLEAAELLKTPLGPYVRFDLEEAAQLLISQSEDRNAL